MLVGQNGFRKLRARASLIDGQSGAGKESAGQAIDLLLYCRIAQEEKSLRIVPGEIAVKPLKSIESVEVSSSRVNDDVVSRSELGPVDLGEWTAEQDDGILR
jgi:hypothetical protein